MRTVSKESIERKIDFKTKPTGALGKLEKLAQQICTIQDTLEPALISPTIFVFAADHGIARDGVSAYPQDVTWQMVYNFLSGGAGINVFAKQNGIDLKVVDAGVNKDFANNPDLIHLKVNAGTKSFLQEKAMTEQELDQCFINGKNLIRGFKESSDCNVIGFGEMGIGNTSSASLIMHCLTGIPLKKCVGKGTGLDFVKYQSKQKILAKAFSKHKIDHTNPMEVLQTFGGFEIATMASAMLESYEQNMLLLIDGFIASAAFLAAFKIDPYIIDNAVFCHKSDESGHQLLLANLGASPILDLGMRLGEGTGCAIAYPIIKSAVAFMNEMASFESAVVSNKD